VREHYLPLVHHHPVIELGERIDANGNVIKALDETQTREAIRRLAVSRWSRLIT
jgi:N-methylhydantoinase A/oxoprolinase/acetone carboxylase beta subunit